MLFVEKNSFCILCKSGLSKLRKPRSDATESHVYIVYFLKIFYIANVPIQFAGFQDSTRHLYMTCIRQILTKTVLLQGKHIVVSGGHPALQVVSFSLDRTGDVSVQQTEVYWQHDAESDTQGPG